MARGAPFPGVEPITRALLGPEVFGAIDRRPIVLAGDAKAFWYPNSPLRYRTVFDVDVPPGASDRELIAAWIGADAPPDACVIVNTGELERFANTYRGI